MKSYFSKSFRMEDISSEKKALLLILIIILFSLLTYFLILESADMEKSRIIQRNLHLTSNLAGEIEQYISTAFLKLEMISGYFQGYWKIKKYNLQEYVVSILNKEKHFSSFVAFDKQGQILFQYHKSFNKEEKDNLYKTVLLPYLQYPLKGEYYISNLINSPIFSEEIVALAAPLFKEGEIVGALYLTLKTDVFKELLHHKKIGETGYVFLRDGLGNIIYHPQLNLIRKRNYKFLDVPIIPNSDNRVIKSSLDNQEKYMTYKPLESVGWTIFVMQPINEYQMPIYKVWIKNGSLLGILFLCLYLFLNVEQQEKKLLKAKMHNERLEIVAELAAGIAHEIKNPLVPIKGFIQLEKSKEASSLGKETLILILNEINRIERIVNDFTSLAKNKHPNYTTLSLTSLLEDTVYLMNIQAVKKGIELQLNTGQCTEGLIVKGDKDQLFQVFINLIKNAIEAITGNGRIEVIIQRLENEVLILIKDTGEGIAPEALKKLGTPFYTTKENGTGLGLMISERIISNHGGRLEIMSELKKGTTVKVYLPLAN